MKTKTQNYVQFTGRIGKVNQNEKNTCRFISVAQDYIKTVNNERKILTMWLDVIVTQKDGINFDILTKGAEVTFTGFLRPKVYEKREKNLQIHYKGFEVVADSIRLADEK